MSSAQGSPRLHSNTEDLDDGRLSAPAAVRNAPAIIEALRGLLPQGGRVLEIAAGTGEHAVALAGAFPHLDWQPSDIAAERLVSIDAWRAAAGVANMRMALHLDATQPDWGVDGFDAVYLANLFHLLPEAQGERVIRGAARALEPGGRFLAYGPFRTGGGFRSEGDARFHARLAAADPQIGYKDAEWVEQIAAGAGLDADTRVEMPANNLILVFRKI